MKTAGDIGTLFASSPQIRGGRPRRAGTGVTVRRIVTWYTLGSSPEEIAAEIGQRTLAQVYAALASYHLHRDAIERDLADDELEAQRPEGYGPDRLPRLVAATTDPATLPRGQHLVPGRQSARPGLPRGRGRAVPAGRPGGVVRRCGLRDWVEQS